MAILFKVTFGKAGEHSSEDLRSLAESYLCTFFRSGQACGEYEFLIAWQKGVLNAYIQLADPHAYALSCHWAWGRRELRKVIAAFGCKPVWQAVDDNVAKRQMNWKTAPSFFLFAELFPCDSPVRRSDSGQSVSVCRLPIGSGNQDGLYDWYLRYRRHERIWIERGPLKVAAYKELADPRSELSLEGRKLARAIEKATGIATYYYLLRDWGRKTGEEDRRCPGCGRKWRVASVEGGRCRSWPFPFRCHRCRLVSHLGFDTDNQRYARIGEYRKSNR